VDGSGTSATSCFFLVPLVVVVVVVVTAIVFHPAISSSARSADVRPETTRTVPVASAASESEVPDAQSPLSPLDDALARLVTQLLAEK